MSREECFIMEYIKKFLGNVMTTEHCHFSKPAHPVYHWLKTSYAYGLVCSLRYVNIQSDNSKIYNCGVENLECKTEGSIIIWDEAKINKCSFGKMDSMISNWESFKDFKRRNFFKWSVKKAHIGKTSYKGPQKAAFKN
ncbi:hypothetical protein BpHYR1_029569 [Brachionus plicatilis]|uniref:Uncharacterized protein n=1 Tax=Brachionus plicatilis TaxID=10195 RepID=A0A3M7P8S0_BRAPC|nr:hypothetical protein BpHYR1_029569 [Brachionus plicatilis]